MKGYLQVTMESISNYQQQYEIDWECMIDELQTHEVDEIDFDNDRLQWRKKLKGGGGKKQWQMSLEVKQPVGSFVQDGAMTLDYNGKDIGRRWEEQHIYGRWRRKEQCWKSGARRRRKHCWNGCKHWWSWILEEPCFLLGHDCYYVMYLLGQPLF